MEPTAFADPWWDLREGESEAHQRELLAAELHREVGLGHPLSGRDVLVVAMCRHCDDVVVTAEQQWAIVHLTWNANEAPPWPATTFFDTAEGATVAAAGHAEQGRGG